MSAFKLHPHLYPVTFTPETNPPEYVLFWPVGQREYFSPVTRREAAEILGEYYADFPQDRRALEKALAPYGVPLPEYIPDDRAERLPVMEKALASVPPEKLNALLTNYFKYNLSILELFIAGAIHARRKTARPEPAKARRPPMTMAEAREAIITLLETIPGEEHVKTMREVLSKYGAKKLSEVPPEKLKDLINSVSRAVMEKTANRNAAPKN